MILCISDEVRYRKTEIIYFGVTVFCGVFSRIYEHYSHGVTSEAMTYLFLYPLIGGVFTYCMLRLFRCSYPARLEVNLYNSGIALLAVGSCLAGIFEIYGTSSKAVVVYQCIGGCFVFGAALIWSIRWIKTKG